MKIKGDGRCYISTVCFLTWVTFEYLMSSQYCSAESEILSTDIHWELGEFTRTTRRQLMAGFCVHTPGQMASLEGKLSFSIVQNSKYAFFLWWRTCSHSIQIPLDRYLPTWRGNVIEAKLEMNPARIVGMSLSVNAEGGVPGAKTGPGDFRLEVDWIKALRTLWPRQVIVLFHCLSFTSAFSFSSVSSRSGTAEILSADQNHRNNHSIYCQLLYALLCVWNICFCTSSSFCSSVPWIMDFVLLLRFMNKW